MSYRSTLCADAVRVYDQWFALSPEDLAWQLQRKYGAPQFVAKAIAEKILAGEQWMRAQTTMLEAANRRIAWLESKVDPELLKPQPRETVSCKPPAEASD